MLYALNRNPVFMPYDIFRKRGGPVFHQTRPAGGETAVSCRACLKGRFAFPETYQLFRVIWPIS